MARESPPSATARTARGVPWRLLGLVLLGTVLALVLLVLLFPWNALREPLNRYVSAKTGRHFEITRRLDVQLGRTTRIVAEGVVFGNPSWARERELVRADAAEVDVRLWPLLRGRIELPRVALTRPQLGLEIAPDGRRSWDLDRGDGGERRPLQVGTLVVDQGSARFLAAAQGADIGIDFSMDTAGAGTAATSATPGRPQVLPLRFAARGRWRGEPFEAQGQTGNVLALTTPVQEPFPAQVSLRAGGTALEARGALASLGTLQGLDVQFDLRGANLADLYELTGVVLPETPRYAVRGRLARQGAVWRMADLQGRLGRSDIAGALALDTAPAVPRLSGAVQSLLLDFVDLAPLVGLRPQDADPGARPAGRQAATGPRKVLPRTPLDVSRLRRMEADVRYTAARVVNAQGLPLDRIGGHVRLQGGVLLIDPMDLGFAGGRLAGRVRIDGTADPVATQVSLDARGLQLDQLFPRAKLMRTSFGQLHGDIDLEGRGATVAQMLGTASGNVALLMGRGRISNLLLEFAGLDGGEIIKFMAGRDQRVELRCAAAAFEVNDGLMRSRAIVLDTVDTQVSGSGTIHLGTEAMDLRFRPSPKDVSILSLRTPLHLAGTFGAPKVGVDAGRLAGRAGLALALGAINPLLGLAATVETGPGQDADCSAVLQAAATPGARPPAEAVQARRPAQVPSPGQAQAGKRSQTQAEAPAAREATRQMGSNRP